MQYVSIARDHLVLCDNGDPNGTAHPLLMQPTYQHVTQMEFMAQSLYLANHSGSAVVLGAGTRKAKYRWKAGTWVQATTTYTDETTDAQSAAANDVPLETLTVNDGFVVLCLDKFNLIDLFVGTAGVGAAITHDFAYSKAGAWNLFTPIANMVVPPPNTAGQNWAAGENIMWWDVFPDWDVTTGAEGTAIPSGYYGIRVRAPIVGTTAALANTLSVHYMAYYQKAVADGTRAQLIAPGTDIGSSLGPGEAASVAFSVASNKNRIEAEIRARG